MAKQLIMLEVGVLSAVQQNLRRVPLPSDLTFNVEHIEVWAGAANADADAVFNVRAGETLASLATIFDAPADRPKILAGQTRGEVTDLDVDLPPGGWLAWDVDALPVGGLSAPVFIAIRVEDGTAVQGPQGEQGEIGPQGPAGEAGAQGTAGADGTIWRHGAGAPDNAVGVNGDYYLRTSNGDTYKRVAGVYEVVGNIKGPQGDPGVSVLDGDVVNDADDNRVAKLQGRTLTIPAASGALADNFNDNSLNSDLWENWTPSETSITISETNNRLEVTSANVAGDHDAGIITPDAYNFTNASLHVRLALWSGYQNLQPTFWLFKDWNNFILIRLNGSSQIYVVGKRLGSDFGNNVYFLSGSVDTTFYLRYRHESSTSRIYVEYSFGGASWTQSVFFTSFDVTAAKPILGAFFSGTIGVRTFAFDDFSTTINASDPVDEWEALHWNSATQEIAFRMSFAGVLFTSGAPVGAPNVPPGYTQLRFDPTAHILYAWNGATWDSQAF